MYSPVPKNQPVIRCRDLRVGLFGGSFNPAHAGHLHISLMAIRKLNLDEIWWLVAPQNPLKSKIGMKSYRTRFESACKMALHPALRVTDIEYRLKIFYSAETILMLKKKYPRKHFVWIMGADTMGDFVRWRSWVDIFTMLPIAIFDRPPYAQGAIASKPLKRFSQFRVMDPDICTLSAKEPPCWAFIHGRLNNESATTIRNISQNR